MKACAPALAWNYYIAVENIAQAVDRARTRGAHAARLCEPQAWPHALTLPDVDVQLAFAFDRTSLREPGLCGVPHSLQLVRPRRQDA
jgi:hypothetical protein